MTPAARKTDRWRLTAEGWQLVGNILFPDSRFAAAHARQLPDAGARGIEIAVDIGVDHARLAALDAVAHRVGELGGLAHAHTGDPRGSRHRREIRVVGLVGAGMLEVGGELAPTEIAALQAADRAVGVVVPYQVDNRYLVLICRPQHVGVHKECAVPDYGDAGPLRRRQL